MKMEKQIGIYLGVPIYLRASVLLWLIIFVFVTWPNVVLGLTLPILLAFSIVWHEFAHILTARKFGIGCKKIVISVLGGVAYVDNEGRKWREEFTIAGAGPLSSLVLGIIFFGIWWVVCLLAGHDLTILTYGILTYGILINCALFIFNLLPAFPMDGGRILHAILWRIKRDKWKALRIACKTSLVTCGLMALGGIITFRFALVIVACYIGFNAHTRLKHINNEKLDEATSRLFDRQTDASQWK